MVHHSTTITNHKETLMRRFTLSLLSLFIATTTLSWAQTETEKTTDLFFSAGIGFPSKPQGFSDYWKMGFNVGGGVGFPISPSISLTGSIDYNSFPFDEDGFLKSLGLSGSGVSVTGGSASIFTITGNVKALLNTAPGRVAPYATAGLGFLSLSTADATVAYQGQTATAKGDSESAFSLLFGAGIEIPAGTSTLFIEGKYGLGFTKGESTAFIPIKAGVKMKI